MSDFPEFMKHPANNFATSNQATPGVEGYVFDGVDGSQMAFWTCTQRARSAPHVHDHDEYMIVVEGCYTLVIEGQRIPLNRGDEYCIARACITVAKSPPEQERSTHSLDTAPTGLSAILPPRKRDEWPHRSALTALG